MVLRQLCRSVYGALPFKHPLFLALRRIWTPPEWIHRHFHFKGIIRVPVDGTSFLMRHHGFQIENEIFWQGIRGGWEGVSMSVWISLVRRARVIVDVGANTGFYSLVAAALAREADVVALEPVPRVFHRLEQNVELNRFSILCIQAAASNRNRSATLYDTPTEHILSTTVDCNLHPPGTAVEELRVDAVRLDSLLPRLGLGPPDLLKIDVETHEPEVLEGLGPWLKGRRPSLLLEVLNEDVAEKVASLVEGAGYQIFDLDEANPPRRMEEIRPSSRFNILLLQPEVASDMGLS